MSPSLRKTIALAVPLAIAFALAAAACIAPDPDDGPVAGGEGVEAAEPATDSADEGEVDEPADTADATDASDEVDAGDLLTGAVADPASLASIEETECGFDELVPLPTRPSCYALSVPENWADPDPADQVVIPVAVFEGDGSDPDPIIYFDGGPGGHTLDVLSLSYPQLVEPFLGSRDYIVFDQRGLGDSEPSLACPELTEVALADIRGELDEATESQVALDAQDACRDRLVAGGADLGAYNSIASANDVEAMRSLLAYEQLNVVGISYGTRLGQTYMRLYPDSIRSIVLDSVFPTGYDLWTNFSTGAERAFEQLFDGCATDVACAEAYPDLETEFFALLDELDALPATVPIVDLLGTGNEFDAVMDGDDVMGLVFGALYDRSQFSAVPAMVGEVRNGNYDTLSLFGSIQVANIDFVSLGMRLSVECNEEIPFESEEDYLAYQPSTPDYVRLQGLDDGGVSIFDNCRTWPAGEAPEVESERITSDVPTLLLAGQYDPITPPAGMEEIAAGLTNSYSFLLPSEGHGIATGDCGAELVNAFIADPASEPDSSCIATSPAPAWVPSSGPVDITLEPFEVDGLFSLTGQRPEGWTDAGNGVFARAENALDPTTLAVQPTGGATDSLLVDVLSDQLDIELVAGEGLDIDGETWSTYSSAATSEPAARMAIKQGQDGLLVLLVAEPDEIDDLYDAFFVDVAAAAVTG